VALSHYRDRALDELSRRPFDVLVIGGGIVGAGVAAEAARLGLAVALVDRADFGSATSSASSKLIHGGLRYLRMGDIRLVREAHQERRALMRCVAPHLVRRLPFLLPLYADGPFRPLTIRAALGLYSLLAGDRVGGLLEPARALRSVPDLRTAGLRACGVYEDAWTNDARLCLANVRAASEAGATVVNYAEVVHLRVAGGRVRGAEVVDRETGNALSVQARSVVNATGPWVDHVRRLEAPAAEQVSRLSKGVHVLVPQPEGWSAALAIPQDRVRVTFAVPWEGMLLLGTTDQLSDADPGALDPTPTEIAQVLAEAGRALDGDLVTAERVRYSFAGLRVLPGAGEGTAFARRETLIARGSAGMVSVAGGKLTTYRRIALDVLDGLRSELAIRRLDRRPRPLPGASGLDRVGLPPELPPSVRSHLLHLYGSLAEEVVALAADDPSLLEPVDAGGPDIAAQVLYAASREWARTPEDVLRRRTTVAVRGLATPHVMASVRRLLGFAEPARIPSPEAPQVTP
jgi:glycerol-3-phosphate dehydrogenase